MTLKLPVQRCAFACLSGIAMSINIAAASGLQIAPVTLTLQATQNADGIWLSNAGENVLNAQVRVFHWRQGADGDTLSPLRDWSSVHPCWHWPRVNASSSA